jgi:hypothetical protein
VVQRKFDILFTGKENLIVNVSTPLLIKKRKRKEDKLLTSAEATVV